jgi:hypothetical protein
MITPQRAWRIAEAASWLALAALVLWGTARVPFHPDEATHIYLSRDFDQLLAGGPRAVTWQATEQPADVLRYRLLEAPLSRYLIGLARTVGGQAAVSVDWDWTSSWESNVGAGALPSERLLFWSRLPAALSAAAAPLLVYALGRRMAGRGAGLAAAALYGLNALTLLHGRRAMSEGPLLLLMLLAAWLVVRAPRKWPVACMAAALALAAKVTAVAVLPALAAGLVLAGAKGSSGSQAETNRARPWLAAAARLAAGAAVVVVTWWAVNPALWAQPVAGLRAMVRERSAFMALQQGAADTFAPGLVLASPGERAAATLYHVFFAPPAYWDVANYAEQTRAAEERYAALPLHRLLRGPQIRANMLPGAVLLGLALAGAAHGALRLWQWRAPASRRVEQETLAVVGALTLGALAVSYAANVPWQRYYLPLLPAACLWAGVGASWALQSARMALAPAVRPLLTGYGRARAVSANDDAGTALADGGDGTADDHKASGLT